MSYIRAHYYVLLIRYEHVMVGSKPQNNANGKGKTAKVNRCYSQRSQILIILIILSLYKSIRPHLEYCIQAWRPHPKKDIAKLKRLQCRATKLIPELRMLSDEDRVQQRKLTTLDSSLWWKNGSF